MDPLAAVTIVLELLRTADAAMTAALQVSALIKKAKEQNRDLSADELASVTVLDDAAKERLDAAIKTAQTYADAPATPERRVGETDFGQPQPGTIPLTTPPKV